MFWDWSLWEFDAVDEGAGGLGASDYLVGSLDLGVSG